MHFSEQLELNPHIRFRAVGGEGVVVDVERGQVMVLNALGLRTLQLISDHGSKTGVLDRLGTEYDVANEVLAADVDAFLLELRKHGVLRDGGD